MHGYRRIEERQGNNREAQGQGAMRADEGILEQENKVVKGKCEGHEEVAA